MRSLLSVLLCPLFMSAQVNPSFVAKTNIAYTRLEYSGEGMFGFEQGDKYGYLDKNGNVIIEPLYSYENSSYKSVPMFTRGYARARKGGKWGLIDKTGKEILPFEYESINTSSMVKNLVAISRKENSKTRYGLVNFQNKSIIPAEYDELILDSNLVLIKQNGKWGLLDHTGKILLPAEYTMLSSFSKAQLLKAEKDSKYGYIDPAGKWVFEKAKTVYTLYNPQQGMILCTVSSKYGFLDLKGNEVITTKYDQAYGFEEVGLAKVGRKLTGSYTNQYGFIDKKGNEIIPLKYETIGSFSEGLVFVRDAETNRYGYMDKTGKWVIKPVFLDAMNFDNNGGAWVKMTDGKYHYINKSGKDLGIYDAEGLGTNYKSFTAGYSVHEHIDYPYVLIDANGKTIKKLDDVDNIYTYSGGVAGYKSKANSLYGFLDLNGNKIIPSQYTGFTGFFDGISKVDKSVDGKTRSGYINLKGEIILPLEYESAWTFRNGWGLVKKDGKYFFADNKGNLKEPARKYDELFEFRSGFAMGVIKGEGTGPKTYYYINDQLKEAFSITASEAYAFWDDVAIVNRGNGYEMMNKKGEVFKTLTGIDFLKFSNDGMLAVKEKGRWGFIDEKGTSVIAPKYDSTEGYRFGYGKVRQGGKWGVVDRSGKEIIEPKYEAIYIGENGVFIYYNAGWGIMDKTGKIITPPNFNYMTTFEKDRALARLGKTYTIVKSPLAK